MSTDSYSIFTASLPSSYIIILEWSKVIYVYRTNTETMLGSTSGLQNKILVLIWHYCLCDRVALSLYREAGFPQEWATVINVGGHRPCCPRSSTSWGHNFSSVVQTGDPARSRQNTVWCSEITKWKESNTVCKTKVQLTQHEGLAKICQHITKHYSQTHTQFMC